MRYVLQCNGQLLRLIYEDLDEFERTKLSKIIIGELFTFRLIKSLPHNSKTASEILLYIASGRKGNVEMDEKDLVEMYINEPYITKTLLQILNQTPSKTVFSLSILKEMEHFENNAKSCWRMIQLLGPTLSFSDLSINLVTSIFSFTKDKTCLRRHMITEIGLNQSDDQRLHFSICLRKQIIEEIIRLYGPVPDKIVDIHEQLCFCLFCHGLPNTISDFENPCLLGWLILSMHSKGVISLLLNVVTVLIENQLVDPLKTLLISPNMADFKQLLLVNLWHPNLADEATMQIFLDLCYSYHPNDSQTHYIEQLCLKIKTRWDTLRRFNDRLSSINKDQETPTRDILALTTMGNTSHIELVSGLTDPTGLDYKVVLDLLDRTGSNTRDSFQKPVRGNLSLETEMIEESCDKSIFYCSVSIRKLWECLVLFTPIETRQTICNYLHKHNIFIGFDMISPKESFCARFQVAIQNNDPSACHELYHQTIVPRLEYIISHMDEINPLSLRLELLENLYNMLYVSERDLFAGILSCNNQSSLKTSIWPLPEMISSNSPGLDHNYDEMSLNLEQNRFVCPYFLFKDVLLIIEKKLIVFKNNIGEKLYSFDQKMAKTMKYPSQESLETRITALSTSLQDMQWRAHLLVTHSQDIDKTVIGVSDIPTCVLFDIIKGNLANISRTKMNLKNRSKSTSYGRKGTRKVSRERVSSVGEDKENSFSEIPQKIVQLGIMQPRVSITSIISNPQMKDKFMLFTFPSLSYHQELPRFCNIDDGDQTSWKYPESLKNNNLSKGNYHFLLDCIPLLTESLDQLTLMMLNCGQREKTEQIYQKYGLIKNENSSLEELLSEIKYRDNFDQLTSRLSKIVTPEVSVDLEETNEVEQPFGKFNWRKLSDLNAKLSSKKENEITEVINQLITLNSRNRPSLRLDQSVDLVSPKSINRDVKHLNCGLLFDIAISGSRTNWQLFQAMSYIFSQYDQCYSSSSASSEPSGKVGDQSKYLKMEGLLSVVELLSKSLNNETKMNCGSYVDLEMGSLVDRNYSICMDTWLSKLQEAMKSLQFNELESDEDFTSSGDTRSRWSCLNNLISFIKDTCIGVDRKELPFKYLDRSIPLYLDSLYSHLETFANFLGKYKNSSDKLKNKTQNSIVQLQHEFSVLKLSPLNALGELIFLKLEDPLSKAMLQISEDLGLNISAVVLENCIPTISSCAKTHTLDNEEMPFIDQKSIYNASSELFSKNTYNLNPTEVVTECLDKIVKILLKNSRLINQTYSNLETDFLRKSNQAVQNPWNVLVSTFSVSSKASADSSSTESSSKTKGSSSKCSLSATIDGGDPSSIVINSGWRVLMALSHDDEWRDLLASDIADLEHVNLDLLKTNNDKLAFFLNLYNLMMIHMSVLLVENGRTNLKYRSLESKIMRSNFCYKVGQIGMLSIEQISQYYLHIPDVTFADLNMSHSEINYPLPTVMEYQYGSSFVNDPDMAIYGMVDGTVSGQPLKIYYPDSVCKDLKNNLSYTIKYTTTYEPDKRQIFLPQIFKWYTKIVYADNCEHKNKLASDDGKQVTDCNFEETLIRRILEKCNEKVTRKYSLLLKLDTDTIIHNIKEQQSNKMLKIIWQSRSEAIGFSFIEKRQDVLSTIPKLTEFSSSEQNSFTSLSSVVTHPFFPPPNYQPTIEAIIHLRDRSPLLACLAYLAIGDDFVSIPKLSSDDDNESRNRSMSTVLMDDKLSEIRSYKYSRIVNEFPSIGNWIMNFWSEWLISRKSGQSLTINVTASTDTLVMYCCTIIPIEIRWAAFTHPLTSNIDQILIDYSLNIMSRDEEGFLNICSALRRLQSQTMANSASLQRFMDIVLVKSAQYWANGLILNTNNRRHLPPDNTVVDNDSLRLQENRLLDCVYAIKDDHLRFSESLRYLDLFNIDNALNLMEYNYATHHPASESLGRQVMLLRVFKRIHDLVISSKIEFFNKSQIPTELMDWHRLQTVSETDPDLVLKYLNKEKEFDLAKCWSRFYMPEEGEAKIEAEYLVSLVSEVNDNEKIVELISHIVRLHRDNTVDEFMKVVKHVINHCDAPLAIIMICAYTIKNNVFNEFESADGVSVCDWRDKVHRSWVGASMLRAISNELILEQYSQLVQFPHLIMEQLIMNAEIDVFRKMMDLYREQKKAYVAMRKSQSDNKLNRSYLSESGNREDFIVELEPERINSILSEYICKALELSAVVGEDEGDLDDLFSSPKMMNSRMSFASLQPDITSSSDSGGTVVHSIIEPKKSFDMLTNNDTFSMPVVPPPESKWCKDSDAPKCMCCNKEKFSMFNRRHHCRRCGRVICSQCSTHRTSIEGVTVRICDDCHQSICARQDSVDRARHGNVLLENHQMCSVADMLYSRHNVHHNTESLSSFPSVPTLEHGDQLPVNEMHLGVGALENGWRLSEDPTENEVIRQMFYYDDAPSVTIAFCLADFHSNSNACGNLLLDRVDYLADFLKPMKNRLPNPEVDYLLVLDIAKQITYKAKLKFSHLNNDVDFDRAENYLGRLDLLNVLVRSNCCTYLPSLSDGSRFIDKIQSLRDKLIREERLELARIVSSKAGLSNDPVFVVMGLHALEEGKYDEARKLFGSCSKMVRYGSQPSSVLPYPCNEIMKILEGNKLSVESAKDMLHNIVDSNELLKAPDLKYREEYEMSRRQVEEAIYYLDTYNAPLQCLQFLCRQHMWSKATDYVFKKNVSRDVFIEGLISPAVTTGHFTAVKSEIFMKEGGLNSWKFYYESLCKFLDKKSCYDELLEFQEKANDHFQAARTLTNYFYLRGAQSYLKLLERIQFLEAAKRHLEKYINQKEKDHVSEVPKLMKYLVLVTQQIEATIFLTDPITINHHQTKLGYITQSTVLPTLFGTPEAVIDLCLTILFCRPSLSDGLQMLCPLMSQCHIHAEKILPKAAVWLLQHPQAMVQYVSSESETSGVMAVLDLCITIHEYYRLDSRKNDEVLLAIIAIIPISLLVKSNMVSRFITLFKSESKKIEAYIVVKDFKRAFSSAARVSYVNDIQKILDLAEEAMDVSGVIELCKQWLLQNKNSVGYLKRSNPS